MQPRTLRRIYAGFFLAVFLLLALTMGGLFVKTYPATLFLELDPLHGLATSLATGVLFSGLILGLVTLGVTLVLGRVWCSWVCPLGVLQDCTGVRPRDRSERAARLRNRYRRFYHLKYGVLIALLSLAAFGITQTGLLDPIALLMRSVVATLFPVLQQAGVPLQRVHHLTWGGVLIGALLVTVLTLPRLLPRAFCRVVCPLGALLGLVSRYALFRIHRNEERCTHCGACQRVCQGACDPHTKLRYSECTVCFNCMSACPAGAIEYRFLPSRARENLAHAPDLTRRRALTAAGAGVVGVGLLSTSVSSRQKPHPQVIRPPGSLPETDFLAKCIKCGACMKVCPTNVLQPAGLEGGFEGLWTPILINEIGFCEPHCTRCGRHCPTGAIRPLSYKERVGEPPFDRPIRIGTAFVDRSRCLPWANGIPCIVCEEVCPTSPKAITVEKTEAFIGASRDGTPRYSTLLRPYVNPERCIGCGVCENKCPVAGKRAIRVSSVGESRSRANQILLLGRRRHR